MSNPGAIRIPLSSPDITEQEISAVTDVLRTPHLSLGPKLAEFESRLARYSGSRFAVAVNSGTSGLHCCVRGFRLGLGDEVITTPFSFIASANVLLYEKAKPVFVDIDRRTLNIDTSRIEAAITRATRAILVVHVFGRPCPMGDVLEIAKRHSLRVIEDACEAIGAEVDGKKVGSLGDVGVFAFYPNKQITTGEGGAVITDDPELEGFIRACRNQGRRPGLDWFDHTELGYNYRMSEINAALGIEQLARIDEVLQMRESVARRYHERLNSDVRLVLPDIHAPGARISWFVYVVRLRHGFTRSHRDQVIHRMRDYGIACGRYFAPIHLQPLYRNLFKYIDGSFPITESESERAIALPFFNRLTDSQIDEVCDRLRESIPDDLS